MPKFQLVDCMVALAGDEQQIVHRGVWNPVTYPEMLVLQYLHGEDAVSDAFNAGEAERDNADEMQRLVSIYGAERIREVFPGAQPRLPLSDDRIRPRHAPSRPKRKLVEARDTATEHAQAPGYVQTQAPPDAAPVDGLVEGE